MQPRNMLQDVGDVGMVQNHSLQTSGWFLPRSEQSVGFDPHTCFESRNVESEIKNAGGCRPLPCMEGVRHRLSKLRVPQNMTQLDLYQVETIPIQRNMGFPSVLSGSFTRSAMV